MYEKYLEFWMKLNTFLRRQDILATKMMKQEEKLTINMLAMKAVIPPDIFHHLFEPLIELLEERKGVLEEMSESSHDFMEQMASFSNEVRSNLHDN